MNVAQLIKSDSKRTFEKAWKDHGIEPVRTDGQSGVTAPVQSILSHGNEEKIKEFKGSVREKAAEMATKSSMDAGRTENFTPLVFDPEIVSILKQNAPVLDVIPEEGQEGFDAVYNIVDSRDDPIGYTSESDATDLTNNNPNGITFAKDQVDMTIYTDLVEISDFTQEAAAHYMNVRETTLGEKVAQHAQRKAQQIFYGDPSQDTQTGFIGDAEGFKGLTGFASDAGNVVDKSGVSSNFVKDIKSVVRDIRQEENANVNNLRIHVSHEFYDVLENEADFDNLTTDADTGELNVGLDDGGLSIGGVPVVPTHNIDSFTDSGNGTTYNAGDPGDVFIFSNRTARYRALMPMSMVPLAKTGLSDTVALAEFGALIEKSQGNFVRHLTAYDF
jgi:hypothetical protein